MALLRTQRLCCGSLTTMNKPVGIPVPRITGSVVYECPMDSRAVIKDSRFTASTGAAEGYSVEGWIVSGGMGILVFNPLIGPEERYMAEVTSLIVLHPGDSIFLNTRAASLDYYISGAVMPIQNSPV